jgi:hypothetical protein
VTHTGGRPTAADVANRRRGQQPARRSASRTTPSGGSNLVHQEVGSAGAAFPGLAGTLNNGAPKSATANTTSGSPESKKSH